MRMIKFLYCKNFPALFTWKSITILLFHQFLKRYNQLIDRLIFSLADILCHTGTDMIRQKDFIEAVERRIDRRHLNQNIRTVRIFLPCASHLWPALRSGSGGWSCPCIPFQNALSSYDSDNILSFLPCVSPLIFSLYDGYYIPHWGILQGKFSRF